MTWHGSRDTVADQSPHSSTNLVQRMMVQNPKPQIQHVDTDLKLHSEFMLIKNQLSMNLTEILTLQ